MCAYDYVRISVVATPDGKSSGEFYSTPLGSTLRPLDHGVSVVLVNGELARPLVGSFMPFAIVLSTATIKRQLLQNNNHGD